MGNYLIAHIIGVMKKIKISFIFLSVFTVCLAQNTNDVVSQHEHNEYAPRTHPHPYAPIEHDNYHRDLFYEKENLDKKFKDQHERIEENKNAELKNAADIRRLKEGVIKETQNYIDRFWIVIAAALVFLMQAGFTTFEVGLVQRHHRNGVGLKNIIDWLVVCLVFFGFGFGLMFGESHYTGLWGTTFFGLWGGVEQIEKFDSNFHLDFFLFQLVFASAAVTIISGALAERTKLIYYVIIALFVGGFIYPIYGHWVWGGIFIEDNSPKLASLGFMDFAGSTVVHSIGAWIALVGVIVVGPRNGRFTNSPNLTSTIRPYNLGYSALGVFILWFGWWGFNGGSNLLYNDSVSKILLNTNLSGAAAGLSAFLFAWAIYKVKKKKVSTGGPIVSESAKLKLQILQEEVFIKAMGGVLGGLVAITASCNIMAPGWAIFIGLLAGIIHNLAFDLLTICRLDDPVGAIPVHGACGILGTLLLVLGNSYQFSTNEKDFQIFAQEVIETSIMDTVGVQLKDLDTLPIFGYNGAFKAHSLPEDIQVIELSSIYSEFLSRNFLPDSIGNSRTELDSVFINNILKEDIETFPININTFPKKVLPQKWYHQLGDQFIGVLSAMGFAVFFSLILFRALKPFGLNPSKQAQSRGDIL